MKNPFLFLLIGAGLLTSGCSTYYFSTVESYHNRIPATENGYFTTEKNGIVVTYSFNEYGGTVNYEVYNTSDNQLFIDLSKSTLVAEDFAVQHGKRASDAGSSDSANQSDTKLFVPPHSRTSFSPVLLYDLYDMRLPKQHYEKVSIGGSTVKGIVFSPENSPLMFRTYLTVVDGNDQSETVFEDLFFISRAYKVNSANNFLMSYAKQRGDIYYFSETNTTGQVLGWTTAIVVVVGVAALTGGEIVEETSY